MKTARTTVAYEIIKNAINSGEITPGAQLVEASLCEKLDMSRTPIREALNKLEAEGYVEYSAGRGFVATVYTVDKIRMIYEKIEAIEGMLAYLVAEDRDNIDISLIEKALIDMEKALEEKNWTVWSEADSRYHRVLYSFCRNEYIVKDLEFLARPSKHVRDIITTIYLDKAESTKAHRAMYEAIKRGDCACARQEAQNHFRWVREQTIACMRQFNIS